MQSFSKMILALSAVLFTLGLGVSQASAAEECVRFEQWPSGDSGSGVGMIDVHPATGKSLGYFAKAIFVENPGGTSQWWYHDVANIHYTGTVLFFGEELIINFPSDFTTNVTVEVMHHSGGTQVEDSRIYYSWNGGAWGYEEPPTAKDQEEPYVISLNAPTMMMSGQDIRLRGMNYENSLVEVCLTHF